MTRRPFVALVGPPNAGKTTLYNQLTGSKHRVVNYPGATVEYSVGSTRSDLGESFQVLDTPGTYSVFPKSPEELVTRDVVFAHPEFGAAHVVIAVADATQLSRHLLIVRQLLDSGFRVVVALTMVDLLKRQGKELDIDRLRNQLCCYVVPVNGILGEGIAELASTVQRELKLPAGDTRIPAPWDSEKHEAVAQSILALATETTKSKPALKLIGQFEPAAWTKKIDNFLLHPVFGLLMFFLIMSSIFTSIFWLAAPLMEWIDQGFSFLAGWISGLSPTSLWVDFLANGLVTSLGAVLVFVPQVAILFLAITLLEDTGYLARAASLVDKPLSKIGLNGRAFVPALSAHACAIPAMLAARTIPNRKERFLTLLIIPLMSCSARLPVYALLLAFLFRGEPPWKAGVALAAIYFTALLIGGIVATLVNRWVARSEKSFFVMELPWYRRPHLRTLFKTIRSKTGTYLFQAGPVILLFAVLVWVGTTFPNHGATTETERLNGSYAASAGKFIEPVMEPLGLDWRVGVGLLSAFAAREVFVSALAVVFNVTEAETDSIQASLLEKMGQAQGPHGHPLFTPATVIGLIFFFMIALQCIATVGVARKEFGNWKIPILQLVVFNLMAYVLAILVVQGLRFAGMA